MRMTFLTGLLLCMVLNVSADSTGRSYSFTGLDIGIGQAWHRAEDRFHMAMLRCITPSEVRNELDYSRGVATGSSSVHAYTDRLHPVQLHLGVVYAGNTPRKSRSALGRELILGYTFSSKQIIMRYAGIHPHENPASETFASARFTYQAHLAGLALQHVVKVLPGRLALQLYAGLAAGALVLKQAGDIVYETLPAGPGYSSGSYPGFSAFGTGMLNSSAALGFRYNLSCDLNATGELGAGLNRCLPPIGSSDDFVFFRLGIRYKIISEDRRKLYPDSVFW